MKLRSQDEDTIPSSTGAEMNRIKVSDTMSWSDEEDMDNGPNYMIP